MYVLPWLEVVAAVKCVVVTLQNKNNDSLVYNGDEDLTFKIAAHLIRPHKY